jgi:phage-related tail protein
LDANTREEFGDPSLDQIVREHVSNIIKLFFEKNSVITQAQILHGLIKHKKLKHATKLLGFQDAKHAKAHENVLENVSKSFSSFGKSRKPNIQVTHREITILLWHQGLQEVEW